MGLRVLLVGVGYLGRRVARLLVDAGHEVWGTTRTEQRFPELRELGLTPIVWDVLAPPPESAVPKVDALFYAVGMDRTAGRSMREVYVTGLKRSLACVRDCKRSVYVSSTGVFGDCAGAWVDESTPTLPSDEPGQVCLAAEDVFTAWLRQTDGAGVILRFAGIYGPERLIGKETLETRTPIAADPEAYLNLIHVDDGAQVIAACLERPISAPLLLVADGHPVRRRDFYAELATLLSAPAPMFDPAAGRRQRGHRQISNQRLLQFLPQPLLYPDYRQGLRHCVGQFP